MRGSVNTFLNAFTYPDRTCYPVASQNGKDFKNLVNVYLDAVLFPRCVKDPNVHAQEGWHLEHENDELTYKGVVYNEMKGVYSSPDSLSNRECQRSLFPDNVYGSDSGGDPLDIPNLSFENFRQFWEDKVRISDDYGRTIPVNTLASLAARFAHAVQPRQRQGFLLRRRR